ncbi:hydroxyacid dehydrogenase [Brevirhabdus pacifica]|uniref:Hydroxyacid dehydrogenase n=1 Tax=Brevirhabdus pacifica TaxID=1267768 RepID=A0A1U7DH88_9RHOB|nr:FAD-binding oxidoreductase [Brevirhabdus pacifica]APX89357.1 hydroxyacid dehydrogenase [Brevirhabdus pacifica]OWU76618.1 2-hydroxyacid dehydrogenase [Loktanella sp. 22II-4b]PJJ86016.1 FAD/FMN-containing dehydrogenase [Brevirhabdus pacifica]
MLKPADDSFAEILRNRLPEGAFRPLEPRYLEEPRGRFQGQGGLLVAPANTAEVALVVRVCRDASVGVVPYGGGTGLVAGQVMPEGPAPVILSLERMNAIREVLPEENVLIAEAGAILENIHTAAEAAGRLFPLTLASKGSARIGGNLATNAGGVNVLRYGNARDLCLGLEAVMPDGTIWRGLSRLRKDNTGFDLRNLLIGSEGALGVITAAALKLFPLPAARATALLAVPDPQAALSLLALAGDLLGPSVSAFELIGGQGLAFLAETGLRERPLFDAPTPWCVLIELDLTESDDPSAPLEKLFVAAMERGLVEDGLIARSEAQRNEFWDLREMLPEANRRIGSISSHDISVPLGAIPEFIHRAGRAVAGVGPLRVNCFGHMGDGNLHYNIFPPAGKSRQEFETDRPRLNRLVHDLTHELGGSISAEHGVGRLKLSDLQRYGDPVKLAAMRAIKNALDPTGIMNPGAVVPTENRG